MLHNYLKAHYIFDENRSYNLDLNKLEQPYLDAYMSQIS